jgi:hypothetical protein
VKRATGIEPEWPAWKASDALWPITPVSGCDQEIRPLSSTSLPVWVENWVENRRCLESVEASAAWSRSVYPTTRTFGGRRTGVRCTVVTQST